MIDVQLLEDKIDASGKTRTYLAACLGISIQTFKKKCTGEFEFKLSEAKRLAREIGIITLTEFQKIFLPKE